MLSDNSYHETSFDGRIFSRSSGGMEWKDRIVTARKEAGLTQAQLGELVGVVQSAVNAWEHGINEPSLEAFRRIATATGAAPEWLVFGASSMPPDEDSAPRRGPRAAKGQNAAVAAIGRLADLVLRQSEEQMRQHTEVMAAVGELAKRLERLEEK